jgi:hypothetical protein
MCFTASFGVLRIGWRPPLAFVRDKLLLDEGVCILRPADSFRIRREFCVAIFTYAKHRNIVLPFDDPKLAFRRSYTDGCCSTRIGRRSPMVMELLKFVENGLTSHELHRSELC